MQYQISSDNMEMTESMIVLTKEKFERLEGRLEHLADDTKQCRVVINTAPEDKFAVKVVANFDGKEYFTDESDRQLESAIISCVNEVIGMLERDQDKGWEEIRKAKGKV